MTDLERLAAVIKGVVAELRERAVREGHLPTWDEALQMIADEIVSPNWDKTHPKIYMIDDSVCPDCGVGAGAHALTCPVLTGG